MKGVVSSIVRDVQIIDISHGIRAHDIEEAAFVISTAYQYFPAGTIHVVVVDPGVGGSRRPLAVSSRDYIFVAPDNGVLSLVLESIEGPADVFHISNNALFLDRVSSTFHGRDVFAPVAAHLAAGTPITAVGPRIEDVLVRRPVVPRSVAPYRFIGKVLRVDRFGNIVTNLRPQHLGRNFVMRVGEYTVQRHLSTYEDARSGELFAIEGSTGYIELSLRQASAAETFNIRSDDEIEVETDGSNQ